MESPLRRIVEKPHCSSYADVLAKLSALESALDPQDGLLWFTRLYRGMTEAVAKVANAQFRDPAFLEVLDCRFAELYFGALAKFLHDPAHAPRAWIALFQARSDRRIDRLQFAIAGVNAHINRDLPVALVTAFKQVGGAPQRGDARHADYLKINQVLAQVQASAKTVLLSGVLATADAWLGQADDMLEIWSLEHAREAAWVAGEVQWQLRSLPFVAEQHLATLDGLVGCTGRALLRPVGPR